MKYRSKHENDDCRDLLYGGRLCPAGVRDVDGVGMNTNGEHDMNTIHLAVGTDENGYIWTYRLASLRDAEDFIERANEAKDLDVRFEYIPVNGVMTADQALDDLCEMKGCEVVE